MKLCVIIFLLCSYFCTALAQVNDQNLAARTSGVVTDLDNIYSSVVHAADSLNRTFLSQTKTFDSLRLALNTKLESIQRRVTKNKVIQLIDSVELRREKTIAGINENLESLKAKTTERLNKLSLPSELTEKISMFCKSVDDLKLTSTGINVNEFASSVESLNIISDLDLSAIPGTLDIDKLSDLNSNMPELPAISKEVSTYGQDIQAIARGDSAALARVSSIAEEKAVELSGFSDIQKQADGLDVHKQQLDQVKDPLSMADQGVEQLQQAAMDHFAGREQVLQAAMDKMSKFKEKYSSLSSLANVPRKRPNEMRGKPLLERIVPAFMVQISKEGNNLLVDFNPYVGFRFTGKITAGVGWNQRLAYDTKANDFTSQPRIFGPRVFGEYNLWKGFCPRVEVEVMNALVAPTDQPSRMDLATRQWVWGVFFGVKKEYKFIKNVKGTALVMTRLFDPDHKSPYADVLNVRIGFEFPMKKKVKRG